MRIAYLTFVVIIFSLRLNAQTPQKMSYQAVIRDANGQLMKNRNIGMQVSVLQGSANGTVLFAERFFPSTNENGLVTVEIGGGLSVIGSFAAIDWKAGPFFIKTETDINGGANYTLSATSQLLSVPYALLAKNVENVPSLKMDDLTDVDATNIQAGQLLKWDGTNWKPANDATTGGPGTTYTPGAGIFIDVNNIISNTGDLSNTNEIQQLELTGNQLKLTGANTVSLPTVTTYTAGPGISLANNTITNTGDNDNDPDNEIQQISLSGSVLTLSQNGGSVTLPSIHGGGDNWGTQHVETDHTISGDGTPSQPLKLANQSATNGQVLKFNGSTWIPNEDNDDQNLSINNNQLTISNGNTITLPTDGDGSSMNEIQTLSLSGANVNLSLGGGSITLPDVSATNEIQTLSILGQNLTLSNGGGTVALPLNTGPWIVSGDDISNTNSGAVKIGNFSCGSCQGNLKVGGITYLEGTVIMEDISLLWLDFLTGGGFARLGSGLEISNGLITVTSEMETRRIRPGNSGLYDLGQPNRIWNKVYANQIIGAKHEGDWLPTANGSMDLGSTSFEWDKLFVNTIVGPTNLEGHILPVNSSQNDLGSSSKKFRDIYVNSIIGGAGNIEISADLTSFNCSGHFNPSATNQNDLGNSSRRWKKLYTNTAVDVSSDKRLKENIFPITFGLKEVLNMEPVSYNLKDDETKSVQFGYLAQDLKKLIPTVVHGDENKEILSVTYTELIPVLTKAIQEQQGMLNSYEAKLDIQQAMIESQNKLIKSLSDRLDHIEKYK